jgi:hypothetical protein
MKRPASASTLTCSATKSSGAAVKSSGSAGANPTFDATQYSTWVASYATRGKCFEELGCNQRCKSHAARAVKKNGRVTHLRCRLRSSTPACQWAAVMREQADGSVDLHEHPTHWKVHSEQSASTGQRGFEDIKDRQAFVQLLSSTPTFRPTAALRTARLSQKAAGTTVQLKQVQLLRRSLVTQRFASRALGQLRQAIAKRQALPANRSKGYFCYSSSTGDEDGQKPKLAVVATTRVLQERWVSSLEI